MFDNNRFITVGVNSEVDIRLQLIMWSLIDELNRNISEKVDYLQVFNICKKDNKILIEHSQEIPKYKKLYEISNMSDIEINNKLKLFVIDDVDHSIMLLAEEY